MANYTLSDARSVLKELYSERGIVDACYKGFVFPALIKKKETASEKGNIFPVTTSHGGGTSHTFSSAQTWRTSPVDNAFVVGGSTDPLSNIYGTKAINGNTWRAMKSNKQAFVDGLERISDAAMRALMQRLAWACYGTRAGELCEVGTYGASDDYFTLSVPRNHVRLQVGQEIVTAANNGAALDAGTFTVTKVSGRGSGTVTVTSDADIDTQIAAFAAGRVCFLHGDYVAAGDRLSVAGLSEWIPTVAPTGTLFGVDRSTEPELLGGFRFDGSGLGTREQALLEGLQSHNAATGGQPDHLLLHPDQFAKLAVEMGGKSTYERVAVPGRRADGTEMRIGFAGLKIDTSYGQITAIPDRFCLPNQAFGVTVDDWLLLSNGPVPFIDDEDGQGPVARISDADAYELRVKGYTQLVCQDPSGQSNITLPAL